MDTSFGVDLVCDSLFLGGVGSYRLESVMGLVAFSVFGDLFGCSGW